MFLKKVGILFLTALILFSSANAEQKEQYKIGVVAALTGPVNVFGIPVSNAMVLAEEELDKDNKVQLVLEDDSFQPQKTVTAVNKLLTHDKIDILIVLGTNQGMAVASTVKKQKIPFISINVNRNVVKGNERAIMTLPSIEDLTAANIKGAKQKGYKKIAIAASLTDSCLLQADIVNKDPAFEVTRYEELSPEDNELRQASSRIIASKPDAVFLSTLPPQGSAIAKRLRSLGFKGDLFLSIQAMHVDELKNSEGGLVGAWGVTAQDKYAGEFFESYRKRFDSEASELAIYGYETIRLILEAIKADDINKFLHSVKDFEGYAGTFSADGKNGYTFEVATKTFTKDGYQYLKLN